MFAFKALFVAALPLLAIAGPLELATRTDTGACNTGNVQCCQSTHQVSSSDPFSAILSGLLGIPIGDLGAVVGLTCTAVNVVGVGSGNSCSAQTVCCSNNQFSGNLIAVGCSPVKL